MHVLGSANTTIVVDVENEARLSLATGDVLKVPDLHETWKLWNPVGG